MLIGLSTGISQFTYAFGPGLLGLVRDATGGYGAALAVCIALNLHRRRHRAAARRDPPSELRLRTPLCQEASCAHACCADMQAARA